MDARQLKHMALLEEWKERVTKCRGSGQTVRKWCEEQGIKPKTYYSWEQKILKAASEELEYLETGPKFVELSALTKTAQEAKEPRAMASIRNGTISIEIYEGAGTELIQTLLQALKSC